VPAQVGGRHKTAQGDLELKQEFQMLTGTLTRDGRTIAVKGKVRGEEVTLNAGGVDYRGKVNGRKLELM
jgi:hypothetical protein